MKNAKGSIPFPFFPFLFPTSIDAGPKNSWTQHPGELRMRHERLSSSDIQQFYFLNNHPSMLGWFKGMEQIIKEHGLWPAKGLHTQCLNFHCPFGCTDCCY